MKKLIVIIALLFSFLPARSWAHHGGISLAFGPGTPIDTSSPLTLPQGGFVLSGRLEQVEWRKFSFADPTNKDSFTFYNFGVSYGIAPFLTGSAFLPLSIKRQDELGSHGGVGDISLLFNLGFNYDPSTKRFGLNLQEDTAVPEGSKKTYLSFMGGISLPTGKNKMKLGGEVDPGMQPGFGSPTFTMGIAASREIIDAFSVTMDTSYQIFIQKDDFEFGNEWRLNLAGVYGFYRRPEKFLSQVDGVLELNLLRIGRDEEGGEKLRATGGTILYLSPGVRMIFPKLWNASLGLLVKFPVVKDLNEKNEQQGAEGLEKYRFIATLSFFF